MPKPSNQYISEDGRAAWEQLEHINRFGYGYAAIFSDWLDLMLNSLLSLTANIHRPEILHLLRTNALDDQYNARYMEITRRYRENTTRPRGGRPADYFAEAFGLLVKETREKQSDILGQIYIERINLGEGGQFFTPQPVVDLMTKLTVGTESDLEERVCDPCCGSGRFLISMAKEKSNALLYGNDIDLRCVKMTALNMWLFDLNATITCGNALAGDWSIGYETRRGGYIREIFPTTENAAQEPTVPPADATPAPSESNPQSQMNLPL